jgi:TolB protein
MNADGTDQYSPASSESADGDLVWSPNGQSIVFSSERDGNAEIYLVRLSDNSLANLTEDPGQDVLPSWSPDGQKIVFTSLREENADIYIMAKDGSDLQRLTEHPGSEWKSFWVP